MLAMMECHDCRARLRLVESTHEDRSRVRRTADHRDQYTLQQRAAQSVAHVTVLPSFVRAHERANRAAGEATSVSTQQQQE